MIQTEPYPNKLIVVPLDNKILLPSVVLRLLIHGKQASELSKLYFRQQNQSIRKEIYVACIPLRPIQPEKQSGPSNDETMSTQAPQVPMTTTTTTISKPISSGVLVSLEHKHRLLSHGCLARIVRIQRSGTDLFGVYVEGIQRFKVDRLTQNTPTMPFPGYWAVHAIYPELEEEKSRPTLEAQFKELSQVFITKMKGLQLPESLLNPLNKAVQTMQVSCLADLLVCLIETTFEERWDMLSSFDLTKRLEKACLYLTRQLHVLQISDKLGSGIDGRLSRRQREFYLKQQLEAIQSEHVPNHIQPTQTNEEEDELSELHRRLVQAKLPNEAITVAQRELQRIKKLQPASSEWAVARNYLEWLSELPWSISTPVSTIHIQRAKRLLDQDHFGLVQVKKRIMEYLSVIKIKNDLKAPIICLVGPPGVGKTSLGKSIAKCMSRQFHRISLGGVRDEADIRGHRRTYVGAMPGLVVQGLRKCKVNNPLFLLDEIDKLVNTKHHGDPAAALLEVLDPEQNSQFADHYLNVGFDLSNVLFLATANSLDSIPDPLLDRMEVIELQGYTIEEKLHIAQTHLIPKQASAHGLSLDKIRWGAEKDLLVRLIEQYTREAGVRQLERVIASVVRHKCVEFAELKESGREAEYQSVVQVDHLESILGMARFEKEVSERQSQPGVVTGLAYTGSGNGGILFVEASRMPGDGRLELTGSLGHVIQESAKLALSWVKSNAYVLQLTTNPKEKLIEEDDIHIHFPSGSIPKDGPSAGITLVCALVSLYSNQSIPTTTAMTGEISLRGQLLPVGGIKEKIVSAHRAGIRKVILPIKNKRDVEHDLPPVVRNEIEICYANTIWQVLSSAFEYPIPNPRMLESHL